MQTPATDAPSDPALSVVVVSFNTREMTLAALRSLRAQTRTPYQLIVIDNASTDGSAAAIAAEFPEALLLAETDNHGFARANNIAARHATAPYLLLLNPDTVVLDGAIDALMDFARANPAAKIWGGRTLFGDRGLNPSSAWRRMSLWNVFCRTAGLTGLFRKSPVFNSEAYGGWDRGSVARVDIVSGCFFLLPTALWRDLGGFDLSYFMYGEEADLCLRATREHDAAPMVTPAATIVHYGGASEAVRSDKMVRLLNAKMTLINRHFPAWQKPLARGLFTAWPLSRLIALRAVSLLRPARAEAAGVWAQVWARRDEWRAGYRDADDA